MEWWKWFIPWWDIECMDYSFIKLINIDLRSVCYAFYNYNSIEIKSVSNSKSNIQEKIKGFFSNIYFNIEMLRTNYIQRHNELVRCLNLILINRLGFSILNCILSKHLCFHYILKMFYVSTYIHRDSLRMGKLQIQTDTLCFISGVVLFLMEW